MIFILNSTFSLAIADLTFAYLDPGSGSVLISIVIALVVTAFYYLRGFFYEKARYIFKRQDAVLKDRYGLVFYSEGRQYWPVFLPLIRALDQRGVKYTYFSSDHEDPGLTAEFANMYSKYIGEGHQAYYVLNNLKADMVVMTTPGLDVLQLKRSKKVYHYCHIVHGLEDTSTYPPYGVDYYDSVLVNGEHQKEVIRHLEAARGRPEKVVRVIGSTYLDIMQEEMSRIRNDRLKLAEGKKTVLLAPSWGEKGFLNKFGGTLIDNLLKTEFQIILRPHPQSWESESKMLKQMQDIFAGQPKLIWDDNPDGLEAMQRSDIMVSDFSGIIFDYTLLFKKPVIVTDFNIDPRKYDMNALPSKSSTLMKLINEGKIGYQLNEEKLASIGEIINEALNSDQYKSQIDQFKDHIYCYPGETGQRGADFLEEVLGKEADLVR